MGISMSDETLIRTLPRALLVLRVTLGLFLLQWGLEKFIVPENTVGIWLLLEMLCPESRREAISVPDSRSEG